MKLTFHGAAQTVTGSMHLLEVLASRILLDCGLFQGRRKDAFEINRNLPFDARSIAAVVVSHAHIDHIGNLPSLVRHGFAGPIYATAATCDLARFMLMDSANIQENDVAYVNRRRGRQGKHLFEPLYNREHALQTIDRFRPIDYQAEFEPAPGIRVHYLDAGHMLGSGVVVLDLREHGVDHRLVFSGDIGRKGLPILRDPRTPDFADSLIMESTYGGRNHEPIAEAKEFVANTVRQTYERGGKLLIPAFAVGRTQEMVYCLNQLWEERRLPPIDVYVDSPLAVNITSVFREHPECFDADMHSAVMRDSDGNPLAFPRLRYIHIVEDSKKLNTRPGPAVIIAASGMCESGRIQHHLKNHIGDPNTTVLFVGYQAESTLGRKLLDGVSPVNIYGESYEVRARIRRADAYSAHAGQSELLEWAQRLTKKRPVRQVFLVHGERPNAEALAELLRRSGFPSVHYPARGESYSLG